MSPRLSPRPRAAVAVGYRWSSASLGSALPRSHRPIDVGRPLAAPSLPLAVNADRNDGHHNPTDAGLQLRADAHPLATGRKIHVDAADPIGRGALPDLGQFHWRAVRKRAVMHPTIALGGYIGSRQKRRLIRVVDMAGGDKADQSVVERSSVTGRRTTPSQRARFRRIVDAAMESASEGGYDAVQMRSVADRAGVAIGTVYRYFPSKNHMLVVALLWMFEGLRDRFQDFVIPGETPSDRILFVLRKNTEVLETDHLRYEALVRAYMFADASATPELNALGGVVTEMFAKAIGVEEVSQQQLDAVKVIDDVWMSSLVSWVAGRMTTDEVMAHLELAVRLVFRKLGG